MPGEPSAKNPILPAVTTSVDPKQLVNFNLYPQSIQRLIRDALALTKKNLTYQYGSSNPKNVGMDCSGAIYYLLNNLNIHDVPRQSDQMYKWLLQNGKFHPVKSTNFDSSEFAALQPGDLLFWSGSDNAGSTKMITHVMMYLGKDKNNFPVVFGSSSGRTYQGKKMRGVSVFDFQIIKPGSSIKFVGYGCIPGLTCQSF